MEGRPKASSQVHDVKDLERQQKRKDSFWLEIRLGEGYEKLGKVEKAIACYKRGAELAVAGAHHMYLVLAWERILEYRPFSPEIHIALAKAFHEGPNSRSWDAKVHCRRAIYLSPGHRNVEAERLLESIETAQNVMRSPTEKAEMIDFRMMMERSWRPPKRCGYLLARVRIAVDAKLQLKEVRLFCRSGDADFDQSALKSAKTAPFEKLRGLQVPGSFDFAFVGNETHHEIDYLSYGSVIIP